MSNLPKIVGIGLSRTGTMALSESCKLLGISTYHYPLSLYAYQDQIFRKERPLPASFHPLARRRLALATKYYRYEHAVDMLNGETALFDLPIPLFVEEILALHPDALFIYTYRSMDGWLESMNWLFTEGRYLWRFNDLDLSLLRDVYGCTTFRPDRLRQMRITYEEKLTKIFSNYNDFYSLDIDNNELTPKLVADLLGIPCKDYGQSLKIRHNERRTCSNSQKWDYRLSRLLPGFSRFSRSVRE